MMNFALKMMNFALEMVEFVFKMKIFAVEMLNLLTGRPSGPAEFNIFNAKSNICSTKSKHFNRKSTVLPQGYRGRRRVLHHARSASIIIFDTEVIMFSTEFIIFNAEFIILHAKLTSMTRLPTMPLPCGAMYPSGMTVGNVSGCGRAGVVARAGEGRRARVPVARA